MKKGLEILAKGNIMPDGPTSCFARTPRSRSNDLFAEFFANAAMTAEDAQKRFAEIIAAAD